MTGKVLVGYATRAGSTREIAEAIGKVFQEKGIEADVLAVKNVVSLDGYRAAVLGAPFYMFRWLADMRRFLVRQRKGLAEMPVAVFGLGPFNDVEKEWQGVRDQMAKELGRTPWLKPVGSQVFGGVFATEKLGFPYNLIPALNKMPAHDIRDWTAIRAWAEGLAGEL